MKLETFAIASAAFGGAVVIAFAVTVACSPQPAPARAPLHMACEPVRFGFDGAGKAPEGWRCVNAETICYLRGDALSCIGSEP